eukprot:2649460-Amphidinium_carterae.1
MTKKANKSYPRGDSYVNAVHGNSPIVAVSILLAMLRPLVKKGSSFVLQIIQNGAPRPQRLVGALLTILTALGGGFVLRFKGLPFSLVVHVQA